LFGVGHGWPRRTGLAGGVVGDQDVGGVDGVALDAVRGSGVGELDVAFDIGGGQSRSGVVPEMLHQQGAIVADVEDAPTVPVLHEVTAAVCCRGA